MHRKITMIGLGHISFPLAVEFEKKYKTTGYDTNAAGFRYKK